VGSPSTVQVCVTVVEMIAANAVSVMTWTPPSTVDVIVTVYVDPEIVTVDEYS